MASVGSREGSDEKAKSDDAFFVRKAHLAVTSDSSAKALARRLPGREAPLLRQQHELIVLEGGEARRGEICLPLVGLRGEPVGILLMLQHEHRHRRSLRRRRLAQEVLLPPLRARKRAAHLHVNARAAARPL